MTVRAFMAKILAVGIATLDVVNEVAAYPEEDAEVRALSHCVRRGGNATNTLMVLSQLEHACAWAGVLTDEAVASTVTDELERYGIDTGYCRRLPGAKLPTSWITLSRATGSRTIVHYRDLPEYNVEDFLRIPLGDFDWLHFEGRDPAQALRMLRHARAHFPGIPVSVEVEKARDGIDELFPYADVLLFSARFAGQRKLAPDLFLREVRRAAPRAQLVVALGEQGAAGLDRGDRYHTADACPPAEVVDTLGAGDTFNAGVIDALLQGAGLLDAMRFACALAGAKCARVGLHDLTIPPRPWSDHANA
jgi:ketohexokinase